MIRSIQAAQRVRRTRGVFRPGIVRDEMRVDALGNLIAVYFTHPIALLGQAQILQHQFHRALKNKNKGIRRKPLKSQGLKRWWAILDLN